MPARVRGLTYVDLGNCPLRALPLCQQEGPVKPYQFEFSPVVRASGWGRMAGVHSTEWILAISAALMSRATFETGKSSSQWGVRLMQHDGQMAFVFHARKRVCSMLRPDPTSFRRNPAFLHARAGVNRPEYRRHSIAILP